MKPDCTYTLDGKKMTFDEFQSAVVSRPDLMQRYLGIEPGSGARFSKIAPDASPDTKRFRELTADIPAKPTQAQLDAWKKANPAKYAELEAMRERVLRAEGFEVGPLYHGTGPAFDVFDLSKIERPGFGYGFHFGGSGLAEKYAKQWEKPWDLSRHVDARIIKAYLKADQIASFKDWQDLSRDGLSEKQIREELISRGYQGINYRHERWGNISENELQTIVVFEPNQIKSAEPLNLDESGNLITPDQWGDSGKDDIRYSYAGEKSNMPQVMRDSLEAAKAMAAAGKTSEEIRAITGWFPGKYDGKMRYEVPDEGATLKDINGFSLKDIIDHPALFEAYPDMGEIFTIATINPDSRINGWYSPPASIDGNVEHIQLTAPNKTQLLSGILHEVQHAIQHRENFARGGDGETSSLAEVMPMLNVVRAEMASLGIDPYEVQDRILRGYPVSESDREAFRQWEGLRDIENEIFAGKKSNKEAYRLNAGESEARDIQARQNYTPEQRAAIAPYSSENIAPEDAIVMFSYGGVQESRGIDTMDTATDQSTPMEKAIEKRMVESSVLMATGLDKLPSRIEVIYEPALPWKGRSQGGKITLNAAHINNRKDAAWNLTHELAHEVYQDRSPQMQRAWAKIENVLRSHPDITAEVKRLGYTEDITEEAAVRLAQKLNEKGPWSEAWSALKTAIGKMLRGKFGNVSAELIDRVAAAWAARAIIKNAERRVEMPAAELMPGSARYSYAGEESNMTPVMQSSMETARAMAAAGKTSEEIRAITGWFPGKYDGKMRYEVPDQRSKIKKGGFFGGKWMTTIGEALDHPELFAAYPELANFPIKLTIQSGVALPSGGFSKDQKFTVKAPTKSEAKQLLMHEIQHWIQKKEGFARGANPFADGWGAYNNSAGEAEANDVAWRVNFSDAKRRKIEPYKDTISRENANISYTVSGDERMVPIPQDDNYARHAELEAKHNAGTITDEEREEAQELVNAAAKAKGYDVGPVYHGTRRQFDVFAVIPPRGAIGNDAGIYWTPDRYTAEEYAMDEDGATDDESRVISGYLRNSKSKTSNLYGTTEYWVTNPSDAKSASPFTGTHLRDRFNENEDSILSSAPMPMDDQDAEYLELAKDPEANRGRLQAMVNDAAKDAGYDIGPVFHGTREEFDFFDKQKIGSKTSKKYSSGFHFTTSKKMSKAYAVENFSRDYIDRLGRNLEPVTDSKSRILKVFIRLNNPLIIDSKPYVTPTGAIDDNKEVIAGALGKGFDGAIAERRKGDEWDYADYVVFDPNQIKSADPVTYDSNGAVIPLSQRFNPESDSILSAAPAPASPATMEDWNDQARNLIAADPDAAKMDLLDTIGKNKAMTLSDEVQIKTAQLLIPDLLRNPATFNEAMTLAYAISAQSVGTDPHANMADRNVEYLAKILSRPSRDVIKDITAGSTPAERARLLGEANQARFEKIAGNMPGGVNPADILMGDDMGGRFDITDRRHLLQLIRTAQTSDSNWSDTIQEIMINNMLSGITTHVVNIAGTVSNIIFEYGIQRPLEAAINARVKNPNAATKGEYKWIGRALPSAFKMAWEHASEAWGTEDNGIFENYMLGSVDHATGGKTDQVRKGVGDKFMGMGTVWGDDVITALIRMVKGEPFNGISFGKTVRTPGRALMFVDSFMKFMIGQVELYANAYRDAKARGVSEANMESEMAAIIHSPGSPAHQKAVEKAKQMTFQQEIRREEDGGNMLETFIRNFTDWRNTPDHSGTGKVAGLATTYFFPFIKTPVNVLRQAVRRTPIGMLDTLIKLKKSTHRVDGKLQLVDYPGDLTADLADMVFSVVGLALMAAIGEGEDDDDEGITLTGTRGYGLAENGERELLERTSGGPMMVMVNGEPVFDYSKLDPFGTSIAFMVDMSRMFKQMAAGRDKMEAMEEFTKYLSSSAEDKTFLSGFENVGKAWENPFRFVSQEIPKITATAFVPNLIRQAIRNSDDVKREKTGDFLTDLAYEALALPSLREPKIDVYGEDVTKGGNTARRMVMPTGIKPTDTPKPADQMAANWNRKKPNKADTWFPQNTPTKSYKNARGEDVEFTPIQRAELQRRQGVQIDRAMKQISPSEIANPSPQSIKKAKSLIEAARERVKNGFLRGDAKRPPSDDEILKDREKK